MLAIGSTTGLRNQIFLVTGPDEDSKLTRDFGTALFYYYHLSYYPSEKKKCQNYKSYQSLREQLTLKWFRQGPAGNSVCSIGLCENNKF